GDGITPDEKYTAAKLDTTERELVGSLSFFYFTANYFGTHPEPMTRDWKPTDQLLTSFEQFAVKRGVHDDAAEFQKDRDWIAERLREEFFTTAFSKDDADRLAIDSDPELRKAVEALPQSKALLDKSKEIVARQASGIVNTTPE